MDTADSALIIAAGTLGITFIDKIWNGSWSLAGKIASLRSEIQVSRAEIEERQAEQVEFVGTTLTSFRDKFRELELYVRDNYVKAPDFIHAMEQSRELQKAYHNALLERLDRVEKKLDVKSPH